ncbi:anthrone oxygenase family protein [uncultured Kordia sp.]|uniref:anthrone oxygenase family protein n=1 Tax=uncultured Kordia sp. TaxID=507699 RepID=UPI00261E126E|nr:anthrone oxygenase family protein [uncultured Kordia sp.]
MKTSVFFITMLLNALSVGFFFAWSVSVILGTKKVGDFTYLETMQHINKEILNPVFFTVFFGSLFMLILNACLHNNNKPVFWFILVSALIYLVGTVGFTAFGNVPLNNELEVLNIKQMNLTELKNFRIYYESNWNQYHTIRTISGMISFILVLISTLIQKTI